MTHAPDDDTDGRTDGDTDGDTDGGAVSEVANLGDGEPISPDQSVAGAPGGESEGVQEGRQGPNAVTGDESQQGRDAGERAEERGHRGPVGTDHGD